MLVLRLETTQLILAIEVGRGAISPYSGTSLIQTSEMQTSNINGHFAEVRIAFPFTAV